MKHRPATQVEARELSLRLNLRLAPCDPEPETIWEADRIVPDWRSGAFMVPGPPWYSRVHDKYFVLRGVDGLLAHASFVPSDSTAEIVRLLTIFRDDWRVDWGCECEEDDHPCKGCAATRAIEAYERSR